jgi:hypothetical protein
MSRLFEYEKLTEDEIIKIVMKKYNISNLDLITAFEEVFRVGFLKGEEYGKINK